MKPSLIAALILMSSNTFAISSSVLGLKNITKNEEFNPGNIEDIHVGTNEIVLTFDDGPNPGVTNLVLDTLKEKNIKAAFFIIASKAKLYPQLMKRIVNEGHIVANHSLNHQALENLGLFAWKKKVRLEVLGAHAILAPYMANSPNFYFRAPEGVWNSKFARLLNQDPIGQKYIGPILWDIGGEIEVVNGKYLQAADWACWSRKISIADCMSGYMYEARKHKGGVVLMHDLKPQSAEMLTKLIPALEQDGFVFKTLDDTGLKDR